MQLIDHYHLQTNTLIAEPKLLLKAGATFNYFNPAIFPLPISILLFRAVDVTVPFPSQTTTTYFPYCNKYVFENI